MQNSVDTRDRDVARAYYRRDMRRQILSIIEHLMTL